MSHSLLPQRMIETWEKGEGRHSLDRALTLLEGFYPDLRYDFLSKIAIGQRDGLLFALRKQLFGDTLPVYCTCNACSEGLEIDLSIRDLLEQTRGNLPEGVRIADPPSDEESEETLFEYKREGLQILFRLPNSRDVAEILNRRRYQNADRELLKLCILDLKREGENPEGDELTQEEFEQFTGIIGECDPGAEILLDLECPACSQEFQVMLDIVPYVWKEISTQAKRYLSEVHHLAVNYGWKESEILSMNELRKQYYLEMLGL